MSALKHWRLQRISAILLIPLLVWLLLSLMGLANFNSSTILSWLESFWQSFLLWVTVTISFYHGKLGMEVILEDYVSSPKSRCVLEGCVKSSLLLVWLLLSIAILKNLLNLSVI